MDASKQVKFASHHTDNFFHEPDVTTDLRLTTEAQNGQYHSLRHFCRHFSPLVPNRRTLHTIRTGAENGSPTVITWL